MRRYLARRGDELARLAPDVAGSVTRADLRDLADERVTVDFAETPGLGVVRVAAFADARARAADFAAPEFTPPGFSDARAPADFAAPEFADDFADFVALDFADDRAAAGLAGADGRGVRRGGAAVRFAVARAVAGAPAARVSAALCVGDAPRPVGVRAVAGLARVCGGDLGATARSYPASSTGTRTGSPSAARNVNASRTALACQSLLK